MSIWLVFILVKDEFSWTSVTRNEPLMKWVLKPPVKRDFPLSMAVKDFLRNTVLPCAGRFGLISSQLSPA